MEEEQKIKNCFCAFIEKSLITHDIDAVMELFSEDIMGIGMGAQGIVRRKEDMRPILLNTRNNINETKTGIIYSNMQIRYYGGDCASICATITINVEIKGKLQKSHIGQCASLHREEGEWKINMVQATPLSVDIQEIDAYPLSFAEDEIEKYRMQEQFTGLMKQNMMATYKVDLNTGRYEEYIPYREYSVPVKKGDVYEAALFHAANDMLDGETRLEFIQTFSLANLVKSYQKEQMDISLDYESCQPDGRRLWLRSSMHLFSDIRGHLKGYLYLIDIDRQKRQELELAQQAELDLMTSVYNKETARKKIELAIELYSKPSACTFFMIDLDHFKQVNDTCGHAEGDRVITETAAILKDIFGKEDVVGRMGGDEFCVFYTGKNSGPLLAEKARQICGAVHRIRPGNKDSVKISVSIGIARRLGDESFDELFRKADAALYVTKKKKGRDGYSFYAEK